MNPNAAVAIKNGKYSLPATPGSMRVRVNSNKVVGKRKLYDAEKSPEADILEERLPARYNAKVEAGANVVSLMKWHAVHV